MKGRVGAVVVGVLGCVMSACSSGGHHDAGNNAPAAGKGCTKPPAALAAALEDELPADSSVSGLIAYRVRLQPPSPTKDVRVTTATVSTALPGLGRLTLHPQWAYTHDQLYTLPGDATVATPHLPALRYVGGLLPSAQAAASNCLSFALSHNPTKSTTPVVKVGNVLRVFGAISATLHGRLNCVGTQIAGTFTIGDSKLALSISQAVSATVIHPPGGAPLWVFLPTPDPSRLSGIRLASNGIVFNTTIPYDRLTHLPRGTTPTSGLTLDGSLPCR